MLQEDLAPVAGQVKSDAGQHRDLIRYSFEAPAAGESADPLSSPCSLVNQYKPLMLVGFHRNAAPPLISIKKGSDKHYLELLYTTFLLPSRHCELLDQAH